MLSSSGRCLHTTTTISTLLSLSATMICLLPALRPIKTGNYCDMSSSDTLIILSEELTEHNGELYAHIRK